MANKLFSFFKQGNDNYEVKDAQARNDITLLDQALNNKVSKDASYTAVTAISIESNTYQAPCDGYARIVNSSGAGTVEILINNSGVAVRTGAGSCAAFIKKGVWVLFRETNTTEFARSFIPFEED